MRGSWSQPWRTASARSSGRNSPECVDAVRLVAGAGEATMRDRRCLIIEVPPFAHGCKDGCITGQRSMAVRWLSTSASQCDRPEALWQSLISVMMFLGKCIIIFFCFRLTSCSESLSEKQVLLNVLLPDHSFQRLRSTTATVVECVYLTFHFQVHDQPYNY